MNLKIDSSKEVVSCKSFEIFKSNSFLEHLRTTLDFTAKEPNVDVKICYFDFYIYIYIYIIKEHKFIRNVLDEDNLKKSDDLKTLSVYYEMFTELFKVFILLEDSNKRSGNVDETVDKDLKDLLRKKCPYSDLFWSAFSRIRTKCKEILSISPYSVRMWENGDQNKSEYGHFSRSDFCLKN